MFLIVFGDENKYCDNGLGSYGVSILIFMDNDEKSYKNYELFDAAPLIEELLRKINHNLMVKFTQKNGKY